LDALVLDLGDDEARHATVWGFEHVAVTYDAVLAEKVDRATDGGVIVAP